MKNRIIILLLSFSILCISIFALPLSIVYATDSYGYTYEEAVDIVNKHNIIYSNEGTPMFIYSSASQLWSAPRYFFTNTYTDKELVDILSSDNVIQYAVTKAKYESISSQLCKALGYATKGASTLVTDMVAKDNRQFAKGSYSDDDGYSLVADSVDKLREQLKKQYYESIGVGVSKPVNTPQFALGKLSSLYEYQEDYISDYNNIKGEKYVFGYIGGNGSDNILLRLNFTDSPDYFYYDSKGKLCAIDSNLSTLYDFTTTVYAYSVYSNYDFMGASSSLFEYRLSYGECGYLGLDFKRSSNNMFFVFRYIIILMLIHLYGFLSLMMRFTIMYMVLKLLIYLVKLNRQAKI